MFEYVGDRRRTAEEYDGQQTVYPISSPKTFQCSKRHLPSIYMYIRIYSEREVTISSRKFTGKLNLFLERTCTTIWLTRTNHLQTPPMFYLLRYLFNLYELKCTLKAGVISQQIVALEYKILSPANKVAHIRKERYKGHTKV